MATRVHEKATCPFCKMTYRTFMLPMHLMTKHLDKVRLYQRPTTHCIFAYIMDGPAEQEFCYCLTCRKGVYRGAIEGQGARWVTIHSKQTGCKSAHKEELAKLRQQLYAPLPTDVVATPVTVIDPFAVLWGEFKAKRETRLIAEETEKFCRENDFGDTPIDFLRQVMYSLVGYKRDAESQGLEIEDLRQMMNKLQANGSAELINIRYEASQLRSDKKYLCEENYGLNERVHTLEALDAEKDQRITALENRNHVLEEKIAELNRRLGIIEEGKGS